MINYTPINADISLIKHINLEFKNYDEFVRNNYINNLQNQIIELQKEINNLKLQLQEQSHN